MALVVKPIRVERTVSLLKDPEVERVSLVEHAANQRPFMLLKNDGKPGCKTKSPKKKMKTYLEKLVKAEESAWEDVQKASKKKSKKPRGGTVVDRMATAIRQGKDPKAVFMRQVRREKIVPSANAYSAALRRAKKAGKRKSGRK